MISRDARCTLRGPEALWADSTAYRGELAATLAIAGRLLDEVARIGGTANPGRKIRPVRELRYSDLAIFRTTSKGGPVSR